MRSTHIDGSVGHSSPSFLVWLHRPRGRQGKNDGARSLHHSSPAELCRPTPPHRPTLGAGSGARRDQSRQHHRRRNHNRCAWRVSLPGSQAWRRLADAARGRGRHCAEQPAQARFRAPTTQRRDLFSTRLYNEFSQRPCDAVGDRVSHHWRAAFSSCSDRRGKPLSLDTRRVSDRAHRFQSHLPGRPLSDRYSRRLVHRCGVGHILLGADGVAAKSRSGRNTCRADDSYRCNSP